MFKDTLVKWNEVHVPTSFLAKTDPEHLFMARPTLSGKKTRVTVRGSFLEFKMLDDGWGNTWHPGIPETKIKTKNKYHI